jgi:hypothetical protein
LLGGTYCIEAIQKVPRGKVNTLAIKGEVIISEKFHTNIYPIQNSWGAMAVY